MTKKIDGAEVVGWILSSNRYALGNGWAASGIQNGNKWEASDNPLIIKTELI
jgi:hypothetical protein